MNYKVQFQVKKPLTVVDNDEDKVTIHCEFDITGSGLTWTAGKSPVQVKGIHQTGRSNKAQKTSAGVLLVAHLSLIL